MSQQNINFNVLLRTFPEEIWQLLEVFWEHQITTVLVGGATRDYIFDQKIAKDLDFEVQLNSNSPWPDTLEKAAKKIQSKLAITFERKPFSIISFKLKDIQLEFAPARLELFASPSSNAITGHSDFDVEIPRQLAWEKAFSRRDFSINTIGLLIQSKDQFQLIDPYHGIEDLNNRVIRPIGDNFYRDPVRLLRAIRFKQKIDGKFSSELEQLFGKFNCSKITLHYFKYESFKTGFWNFCHDFFKIIKRNQIALPEWLQKVEFLGNITGPDVFNENEAYAVMTSLRNNVSKIELDQFAKHFLVSSKVQQDWKQLDLYINNEIDNKHSRDVALNNSFEVWQQRPSVIEFERLLKLWPKILNKKYNNAALEFWKIKYPYLNEVEAICKIIKTLSIEQIPAKIAPEHRSLYLVYMALQTLK